MRKILFLAPLALSACGGPDLETACQNYIDAANTCAEAAYGGDKTYDIDASTTCAAYDGVKGAAAKTDANLLQCYADAYNNGDCSTTDGYTAAATDASGCTGS